MAKSTRRRGTPANAAAYRFAWSLFWGNMTALEQIVAEEFPDGDAEGLAPTRYEVDALRDLAGRLGALVEGHVLYE